MSYSINWDSNFEATPSGSESKSLGDDRIRELKVAVRERCKNGWWDETRTIAYGTSTTFTVGGDATRDYVTGRAFKGVVTAGTVYSYVSSSSYDSGTGKTTVTLTDAVLDSGLSEVYYGQIPKSAPLSIEGAHLDAKLGGDLEADGTSNDITIKAGGVEVGGKWYSWDSDLTFTAGSSGSNSGSDALPSSNAFVYIYVDASALPSDPGTALTASNFISKSTAPSWNASKHGWYDGDDRCIGAMLYDASATAFFYQQKKGSNHSFANKLTEVASASDISQIVTLSAVPGAGIAVGWKYLFGLESGSAGSRYISFYPTDGTSNLGSYTRFHQGTNLVKFWGNGIFNFAYPHNKVNITTGASTTVSNVYTTGFIYHDAM